MNETQKHTPGPWHVIRFTDEDGDQCIAVGYPERRGVSGNDYRMGFAELHVAGVYNDGEADARLIASAPDLLAACRAAFEVLDETGCTKNSPARTAWAALRAAIARAEGGQS